MRIATQLVFALGVCLLTSVGCSSKAETERAKAEAEKAKAEAARAQAELELARLKNRQPGGQGQRMPDPEPAGVSNLGIVLDKGTFATDLHLTNRDARKLDDVELNAKLYFPGYGLSSGKTLELSFNKAMPSWKPGETVSITNFATYKFQKVVITGTAFVGGKKIRINSEKEYR